MLRSGYNVSENFLGRLWGRIVCADVSLREFLDTLVLGTSSVFSTDAGWLTWCAVYNVAAV